MQAKKQAQTHGAHGFSQFELTTDLLRKLYKFNLTPVAKLVLLELTTHLNPKENGSVVFPSIQYLAETLGVGLTSTKQAIKELINEGLIIKAKRGGVTGNRNKYLITPKVQNPTVERSETNLFKRSDSDLFYIVTKKKEQRKEPNVVGNSNFDRIRILKSYAEKHFKKSPEAYFNWLLLNKTAADDIINNYKKAQNIKSKAQKNIEETRKTIEEYRLLRETACAPSECAEWLKLKEILRPKKTAR